MYYFSYEYLPFFLGITMLAYFLIPQKKRWVVLLIASLFFYFYYVGVLSIFMLMTSASVYLAALWLDKIETCMSLVKDDMAVEKKENYKKAAMWQKKAVVISQIITVIGLLAVLKYYNFFTGQVNQLILPLHIKITPISIALPLGVSFYSLQAISYVIDVYRGQVRANSNYGKVLLFLCFFPQIVEGPIGRYDKLAPQLCEGHGFDFEEFAQGAQLILWGLFKKIVIADRASMFVNQVFDNYAKHSGLSVILAVLLYTLQLYAEFSGTIDVVTGSAQMFGIHLAQNFRRPFFACSVDEFWHRWHITLGAWMRDYIFYPVSLSRPVTKLSNYFRNKKLPLLRKLAAVGISMFFVWACIGIWHGAGWKYLVYGMYYFFIILLGIIFEPLSAKAAAAVHLNRKSVPYRAFQIIRTFILVNIGMLIFRASSLHAAFDLFLSMFKGSGVNGLMALGLDAQDFGILGIGVIVLFIVGILQEKGIKLRRSLSRWPLPLRWGVYLSAVFVVIIFGAYGTGYLPADLIYAKF